MSETAASYDADEPESERTVADRASTRVVEAVAAAADADPLEMAPLADVVDPEALDGLFASGAEGRLAFRYDGHDVTVHSDGRVLVDDEAEDER